MLRMVSIFVLMVATVICEPHELLSGQPGPMFFEVLKNGRKMSITYEQYTPPRLQQELEQKVLKYLRDGRQAEAERLLEEHVKTIPPALKTIALLRKRDRIQALAVVKRHAELFRANQRLFYWYAACERSRFDVDEAGPRFILAGMANEKTVLGQSTFRILGLDGVEQMKRNPDASFTQLENMVKSNPDEVVLRWMLAVECRSFNRNEQGVRHYKKILERWEPGPVMAHQTYANLLHELNRYDEALVERRKAVAMEPASWSYDGLAVTLHRLNRFEEANEAHQKAVLLVPSQSSYWSNWAFTLLDEGRLCDALEKCEEALRLEPKSSHALLVWGHCQEAVRKNQQLSTHAAKPHKHVLCRLLLARKCCQKIRKNHRHGYMKATRDSAP